MTREAIVALFDRRNGAWQRRDLDALTEYHADNATWHSPMQGQLEGKTRIRELYKTWLHAFPDLTFTSSDILIDGNRAVQFFTLTGTQAAAFGGVAATGRRIQFNGAWLYEFDEAGLITHSRLLYDVTNVLVQLGALKTKPGA